MLSVPLNKGDFYETSLPIGWFRFTLCAVQAYNLHFKFSTETRKLHYRF